MIQLKMLFQIYSRVAAAIFLLLLINRSVNAQTNWNNLPTLPGICYSEKDPFVQQYDVKRTEVKKELEAIRQKAEDKAMKMTDKERMEVAMRYQTMSAEEIVKMQNEMTQMNEMMVSYQQSANEIEEEFNTIESNYRSEFGTKLGKIEEEYRKLPVGEGTPDWAIKKGNELMAQYKREYELLCSKYFIGESSAFQTWLKEYKVFLQEKETPFNVMQIKMQYKQLNIEPDINAATLMAIDKYLDKCYQVFSLRKPYL